MKCSVIVPAFNAEKTLERCLNSIKLQTIKNIEVIIINDGSSDSTLAIALSFSKCDKRFKVLDNKRNFGVSHCRNLGISIARGDYVGWVDADDFIPIDFFERLIDSCESNHTNIAICDLVVERRGVFVKRYELAQYNCVYSKEEALKLLCRDDSCKSWLMNKIFKRELFEGVAFPDVKYLEDFLILHIIFLKAGKVSYTKNTIYHYNELETSLTHNVTSDSVWDWVLCAERRYKFLKICNSEAAEEAFNTMIKFIMYYVKLLRKEGGSINGERRCFIKRHIFDILLLNNIKIRNKLIICKTLFSNRCLS